MRMKKRSRLGFTLVELIVVIAILAILAGVAIPVYSGYIKKANEAADQQLLAAANSAFAAACLENGVNVRNLTGASLSVVAKKITGISNLQGLDSATFTASHGNSGFAMLGASPVMIDKSTDINNSFLRYFGDNVNTELKYYTSSADFEFKNGAFHGKGTAFGGATLMSKTHEDGVTTYTFELDGEEVVYTISDEAVEAVNNSTFGTDMTMGDLMGEVDSVIGAAIGALSHLPEQEEGESDEDYAERLEQAKQDFADGMKTTLQNYGVLALAGLDPDQTYTYEEMGNSLVLLAANITTATTDLKDGVKAVIDSGNVLSVASTISSDPMGTVAKVAAIYGVMTGLANSDVGKTSTIEITDHNPETGEDVTRTLTIYDYYQECSADLSNATRGSEGLMKVLNMMDTVIDSEAMTAYMTAPEGGVSQLDKDLDGYIGAMSVIAGNTGTLSDTAISEGFDSTYILSVLNTLFG